MGGEAKVEVAYNIYNYYNTGPMKLKKTISVNSLNEKLEQNRKAEVSLDASPIAIGKREALFIKEENLNRDIQSQYLTKLCGILCLLFSFFILAFHIGIIGIFNSKLMERNKILDYFRRDETYEFAIPLLMFPFGFFAFYANWQALKFFKHA